MAPQMKGGVLTVALQECKYANSILRPTGALAIEKKKLNFISRRHHEGNIA